MSSIGGASGSDGVVRSSTLAFLSDTPAQEQISVPLVQNNQNASATDNILNAQHDPTPQADVVEAAPRGLQALCAACARLYPTQQNPLQVTTRLKYWLGGQDPLDYISMYWNEGDEELRVPPHWHYVSFGLSDLHGDGRVHPPPRAGADEPSGFGIEITMRVRGAAGAPPPLWPATLMQALARYVFVTGIKFCYGDHVSWHAALDGARGGRVRHLLVARDAQLAPARTPHGAVAFLQMVGCTSRELRAAQRSSGGDVLEVMQEHPLGGGAWLVCSARRRRSCVGGAGAGAGGAGAGGAQLAGVAATLSWSSWTPDQEPEDVDEETELSPSVEEQIKRTLRRGLSGMAPAAPAPRMSVDSIRVTNNIRTSNMSTDSFEMSSMEQALPDAGDAAHSWSGGVTVLPGLHLVFNAESAALLPLAINGRVLRARHFTWQAGAGGGAGAGAGRGAGGVTALGAGVRGALASRRRPYAARGRWLQMYIPEELALEIAAQAWGAASSDSETDAEGAAEAERLAPAPPYSRLYRRHALKISVLPDHCF